MRSLVLPARLVAVGASSAHAQSPAPSSAPTTGYLADRLADDVLAVLDTLRLQRPLLIGHSLAGEELSSIGSRFPDRVAGLVYLDAGYWYAFYDRAAGNYRIDLNEAIRRLTQLPSARPRDQARLITQLLETDLPALERSLRERRDLLPAPRSDAPPPPAPPEGAGFDLTQAILEGRQRYTVYAGWSTRASGLAGTFERLAIVLPLLWTFTFLRRLSAGMPLWSPGHAVGRTGTGRMRRGLARRRTTRAGDRRRARACSGTRGAPPERRPRHGGLATPEPDGYNRFAPSMPRAGHGGKPPYRRTVPSTGARPSRAVARPRGGRRPEDVRPPGPEAPVRISEKSQGIA
jgi:pimeloyl-ACP methyl ester carboxylesterase